MQISAFVDGELPDNEADLLLRRMSQDAELRRQAAEFLEIGRALRGEAGVAGIDGLLERVTSGIEERPAAQEPAVSAPGSARRGNLRPLFGMAVAASVAVLAVFGLQMRPAGDVAPPVPANVAQDSVSPVQLPLDEQLRQYYLNHGATSSQLGANGISARFVSLRLSEEVLPAEAGDEAPAEDAAAPAAGPAQP